MLYFKRILLDIMLMRGYLSLDTILLEDTIWIYTYKRTLSGYYRYGKITLYSYNYR